MAITFPQQKKRQLYLILVLGVFILITLIVIWYGFFLKRPNILLPETLRPQTIDINFKALDDPRLEELQSFKQISSFEGEAGRENPFIPY